MPARLVPLGWNVLLAVTLSSKLEALLIQFGATPIIERRSTLGIEQQRVAMPRTKGGNEADVVAEPAGCQLRGVVRGKGAVDFIENPEAVVVERQTRSDVQGPSHRHHGRRRWVEQGTDEPSVRLPYFNVKLKRCSLPRVVWSLCRSSAAVRRA